MYFIFLSKIYFEIIVDTRAVIRNNSEIPSTFYIGSPIVSYCKTIVHYHNQNIYIGRKNTRHFHYDKDPLVPFYSHTSLSPTHPWQLLICSLSYTFVISRVEIIQRWNNTICDFLGWLCSLGVIPWRLSKLLHVSCTYN